MGSLGVHVPPFPSNQWLDVPLVKVPPQPMNARAARPDGSACRATLQVRKQPWRILVLVLVVSVLCVEDGPSTRPSGRGRPRFVRLRGGLDADVVVGLAFETQDAEEWGGGDAKNDRGNDDDKECGGLNGGVGSVENAAAPRLGTLCGL